MKLNIYLLLLIGFQSLSAQAQRASEVKVNSDYARFGIEQVSEYYYSYSGFTPCDSTPRNIQYYNEKGQMTKQQFPSFRFNPYYTFEYNAEGFLIDIDTNGLFGYGSSSGRYEDTSYEEVQECWIRFDTTRRLVETRHYDSQSGRRGFVNYEYDDSTGKLIRKTYYDEVSRKTEFAGSTDYEYDPNGFLLKTIYRDENGIAYSIAEFVYVYREG